MDIILIDLIALTPEIAFKKTAMGLPPVTSSVFLIANYGMYI
jgi:hypothetical protein